MSSSTKWIRLAPIPKEQPTRETEFIVLWSSKIKSIVTVKDSTADTSYAAPMLLKYLPVKNEWKKLSCNNDDESERWFIIRWMQAAAINNKGDLICLQNEDGTITEIKLDQKSGYRVKTIENQSIENMTERYFGRNAIIMDKNLHITSGGTKHITYNIDSKKIDVMHDMKQVFGLEWYNLLGGPLIQINNDEFLIFGLNLIRKYNVKDMQWVPSTSRIPKSFQGTFSCRSTVSVLDCEIILLFNNCCGDQEIYIYSVQQGTFEKSEQKCPVSDTKQVISGYDYERNKLKSCGYVKRAWKDCRMKNHLFPPQYLILIIGNYCLVPWIHVFSNKHNEHWKIRLSEILKH